MAKETNFKQYDTRWSKLGYPKSPCTIGNSGCGEVAIANAIIEMNAQANQTPKTIQPHCKQYAAPNCDGTYWSGIPAMLKHYGCTEVMEHQNMASLWKELKKGGRVAIYMMNNRPAGSKGIIWTSGGHFIMSSDYRYDEKTGEHWVYIKDSNSPKGYRNGWMTYRGSLVGDVSAVWSGKLNGTSPTPPPTPPTPTPKKPYTGKYPVVKLYLEPGDRGENVTRLQNYLDWYTDGQFFRECGKADGVYGNNTLRFVNRMLTDFFGADEADGKVGNKAIAKMKEYGADPSKKPTPPAPSKTIKMIDVSDFQSNINWAKVKADGVKAVIIRCGGRGGEKGNIYEDTDFFANIKGAYKAGLAVGIYFLTQAINAKEGKSEAQYTIKRWAESGIPISFPICIDSEDVSWEEKGKTCYGRAHSKRLSKAKRTAAIKGFADECKRQGYKSMLYASTSYLEDHIDMSVLAPLMDVWVAQYYKTCQYKGKYIIWQYTSEGSVSGIKGDVDMDWCYVEPNKVDPPKPEPKPEPTPTTKGKYPGQLPTYRLVKTNAEVIADTIAFAKWIAANNDFHYGYGKAAHKCGCYFCKTQPKSKKTAGIKMWEHSQCCNPFVHSCFAHGGCIPSWLDVCLRGGAYNWNSYPSLKDFKKVSGTPKAGDIVCSSKIGHTALSLGGNKVIEASGGDDNVIHSKKWNNSIRIDTWSDYTATYRYTGSVNADVVMRHGEVSKRVALWQDFLNWWSDGEFYKECGGSDNKYGDNTYKWTVKFQEAVIGKGTGDGTVGPITLKAAANVEK